MTIVLVTAIALLKLEPMMEFVNHHLDKDDKEVVLGQEAEVPERFEEQNAQPIETVHFETEFKGSVQQTYAQPRNVKLTYAFEDEDGFVWVRENPIDNRLVPDGDIRYENGKYVLEAGATRWIRN